MSRKFRFDIVVANRNRCESFWNSLKSLKNLDLSKDRIIILDCSDNSVQELQKSLTAIKNLKFNKLTFYFFKRRNWNLNHGAQLDYIRLIGEEKLEKPQFTYFMQEHYLDKKNFVKSDTIPENETLDLNDIFTVLKKNGRTIFFCARYGFRISATIPDVSKYGKNTQQYNMRHLKNTKDICFVIDGGNFCLDISHYLGHFFKNKDLYTKGNGCYNFSHVWETRLCKILYDQGLLFFEKHRNLKYKTIAELKSQYPDPGKIWMYFYHIPEAYLCYGRDINKYKPEFKKEYFTALENKLYLSFKYDRNTKITRMYPYPFTIYE